MSHLRKKDSKKKLLTVLAAVIILAFAVSSGFVSAAFETELLSVSAASDVHINAMSEEVHLYVVGTMGEKFGVAIPSTVRQSYQLVVTGASSVSYSASWTEGVQVTSSGLVTPRSTTYYWYGNVGYSKPKDGREPDKVTKEYRFGKSSITVTADGVDYNVNVYVDDYTDNYVDGILREYLSQNITSGMTTPQKLDVIAKYVANKKYDYLYSSKNGMVLSGGGDCWASTHTIVAMAKMVGLDAWSRSGKKDPGAGSGHMNAMAFDGTDYYEVEAGYNMTPPRIYYVTKRSSLFSYKYNSTHKCYEVFQYDGKTIPEKLVIPSVIEGNQIGAVGDSFLTLNSDVKEITVPSSVKYIGESAFNSCTKLEKLTISGSIERIGNYAFIGCTSLKTLQIGGNVYSVDGTVVYKGNTLIAAPSVSELSLRSGVNTIGFYAMSNNSNITSVTIPDSVETIEEGAFCRCDNLKTVVIGSGVKSIDQYAFAADGKLTDIFLPRSLTSLGDSVFHNASGILHVWFGGSEAEWNALKESSTGNDYLFNAQDIVFNAKPSDMATIKSIRVKKLPDKTLYYTDETLVTDGLLLEATLSDGSKKEISSGFTCSPVGFDDAGVKKITVTYANFTCTFNVTVGNKLYIYVEPENKEIVIGEIAHFYVGASGDGLKYKWLGKTAGATQWTEMENGNESNINFLADEKMDKMLVKCEVTDQYGKTVSSAAATLTVTVEEYDLTMNIIGGASKLYEPWGLRYYAVYEGKHAGHISYRGIAILKDTYYRSGMSAQALYVHDNVNIFAEDTNKLEYEQPSSRYPNGRYFATLTKGIYSQDISAYYYVAPFVKMADGTMLFGTVKKNSMENILKSNLNLSSITPAEKAVCRCILDLKESIAKHYSASGIPGASTDMVIPRGSSQKSASVISTASCGITPNINGGASRLIEPWGLRFYAVYTDSASIADRGVVMLNQAYWKNSYNSAPDSMRTDKNAYVFRESDKTLAKDNNSNRYYATLTEGISSKNISDVYYVVPFAVLKDGRYVYGTVKSNSMLKIMNANLKSTAVPATERAVSQDIIDLYNAVKVYNNERS